MVTMDRAARTLTQRPGEGKAKPGDKELGRAQKKLDGLKQAVHTDSLKADVRGTAWRLRRQAVPHLITGVVYLGGLAEHSVAAHGHSIRPVMTAAAFLSAVSVPVVYKWIKKVRKRWAKRAATAAALAGTWLAFVAPFGIGPLSAAALVAAEFVLALKYWRANRIPYPDSAQRTAMERARQMRADRPFGSGEHDEPQLSLAQQTMAEWKKFVATTSGGPVPDSSITNPVEGPYTITFDGMLARGKHSFNTLLMAMPRIASALDTRVENLIFEPVVDDLKDKDDDGSVAKPSEARFKFQLVTNSPIRGNIEFTGPRREGGTLYLGPYADGSGEAAYRLYTPGSMWSGVVIGGTGIGKSRLLENLALCALSGGDTNVIYIDPQRGTSSPVLKNNALWFGTMDDVDLILDAILAGMGAREEENAYEGWTGFNASPERRGNLIIIDESHKVFSRDGERWSYVAREGRKLGFGLLVADQYPGLMTFGGVEPLRSSIMEGNSIVMRSTSNQTGQLMPGLSVDPRSLPKIPGYAYVNGSEENGMRTAPFRNRNTRPMQMTDDEAYNWLDGWFKAQPEQKFDTLIDTAFKLSPGGEAYTGRAKTETEHRDRARARVEALRSGLDPDEVAPSPVQTIKLTRKRQQTFEHGEIMNFPDAVTEAVLVGDEAYSDDGTIVKKVKPLTESQKKVIAAVTAGVSTPSAIEKQVGLTKRQVHNLLNELVERGELQKTEYGQYARPA